MGYLFLAWNWSIQISRKVQTVSFWDRIISEAPCGPWGSLSVSPSWTFRECVECDKWNAFIAPLQVPQVQQQHTLKWTQKSRFLPPRHGVCKVIISRFCEFFHDALSLCTYGTLLTWITKPMLNNFSKPTRIWGIFRKKIRAARRGRERQTNFSGARGFLRLGRGGC